MPIARTYNKVVTTQRLGDVAGSFKETWSAYLTDVACTIHPAGAEEQNLFQGAFYLAFKMWCPVDTDIAVGDRVIDGTTQYEVKGVSVYDFGSESNQHRAVLLLQGQ